MTTALLDPPGDTPPGIVDDDHPAPPTDDASSGWTCSTATSWYGHWTPRTSAASNLISVLSLPLLLDRLVPMLAAAVDGDPATEVPS